MRRVAFRNERDVTADLARLRAIQDYVDLWVALKAYFAEQRGYDLEGRIKIPRTTNADVAQLAAIWDRGADRARDDLFGMKGAKADWRALSTEIQTAVTADPDAVYANNHRFWHTSKRLAMHLQQAAEQPEPMDVTDALLATLRQLPVGLAHAAEWLADGAKQAVGGAAATAGDATGSVLGRVLGPLARPLVIGAGIVGGAVLLGKAVEKRGGRRAG